jgi:hypothetical protein
MAIAQVHRFRDRVAVYIGTGPTQYLTPKEARAIAKGLNKAARSCDAEPFAQSTCGTVTVPLTLKEA